VKVCVCWGRRAKTGRGARRSQPHRARACVHAVPPAAPVSSSRGPPQSTCRATAGGSTGSSPAAGAGGPPAPTAHAHMQRPAPNTQVHVTQTPQVHVTQTHSHKCTSHKPSHTSARHTTHTHKCTSHKPHKCTSHKHTRTRSGGGDGVSEAHAAQRCVGAQPQEGCSTLRPALPPPAQWARTLHGTCRTSNTAYAWVSTRPYSSSCASVRGPVAMVMRQSP
jgi:hypothetical protein